MNYVCVIKVCFKINASLQELIVNSEPYTLKEINDEEKYEKRNIVILMDQGFEKAAYGNQQYNPDVENDLQFATYFYYNLH